MSSSLVLWSLLALLVFWAMGAYNRLVRLRSQANTAFAALEVELASWLALAQSCLPARDEHPASTFDGESVFWGGLAGAAAQFGAALAAARTRPLDPDGMAALGAAQGVLAMAWARVGRAETHDLAGPRLPDTVVATHARLMIQAQNASAQFNEAVARYNAAIDQFPASVLAAIFGFGPALPLAGLGPDDTMTP